MFFRHSAKASWHHTIFFLATFAGIRLVLGAQSLPDNADTNGKFMINVVECLSLISESCDESQMSRAADLTAYLRYAEKSTINGNDVCDKMKPWLDSNHPVIAETAADLHKAGKDLVLLGQNSKARAEATASDRAPEILARTQVYNEDLQKRIFAAVALAKNNDEQRLLHLRPEDLKRVIAKIEVLFAEDVKRWDQGDEEIRGRFLVRAAALNAMMIRSEYREVLSRRKP
jgi:hypothetical protein